MRSHQITLTKSLHCSSTENELRGKSGRSDSDEKPKSGRKERSEGRSGSLILDLHNGGNVLKP